MSARDAVRVRWRLPNPRELRGLLPSGPLARIRLFFLVLAVATLATAMAAVPATGASAATKAILLVGGSWLGAHWVTGHRRGTFPVLGEPFEAAVIYLLLIVHPGDPFVPMFGLLFRSLYGGLPIALLRYAVWSAALLGAHAPRGSVHLDADIARALALSVAPPVMQALRAALESWEVSERRLRSLVEHSTDIMTVVGGDLRIRWQAESILGVLGHQPRTVLDRPLSDLVHPDDRPTLDAYFRDAEGRPDFSRTLALRLRHADGDYRRMEVVAANRLHDMSVCGFVMNMRDATERLRLGDELRALAAEREHDALHDALTGLPNRRKLFERLEVAIAEALRRRSDLSLLLFDLDHFKELNDTLGHQTGDELLRELPRRVLPVLADGELLARLGGDEFAVLLAPGSSATAAEQSAHRILGAIEQPFRSHGVTLLIRASIGIATCPDHAGDVETLVQRADVAMYSAKSRGTRIEVYNAARDAHSKERLALMGELPQAVARDELVVHYQPKVDLRTGQMTSAEALVRWDHPRYGMLGPGAFLPIAEQIGVMRQVMYHVLDRALGQCARWRAEGRHLVVAVNLSAPDLLDLALPGEIDAALRKWRLDASCLQLEITETLLAADITRIGEVLERLRLLGIALSLDDFGTGSSSLSYLRKLPVQELKIDKSFIVGIAEEDDNGVIVRATIDMARSLGMRTVAEGIESPEVLDRLTEFGCDEGQGYLLGRPVSADELFADGREWVAREAAPDWIAGAAWRAAA